MSVRYIKNLWSLCSAAAVRDADGEDRESEPESDVELYKSHAGSLEFVRRTLDGIADQDSEERAPAFGRYQQSIKLGRAMWATPPVPQEVASGAYEPDFERGQWPSTKDAKNAAKAATKQDTERPMPYQGASEPSVTL